MNKWLMVSVLLAASLLGACEDPKDRGAAVAVKAVDAAREAADATIKAGGSVDDARQAATSSAKKVPGFSDLPPAEQQTISSAADRTAHSEAVKADAVRAADRLQQANSWRTFWIVGICAAVVVVLLVIAKAVIEGIEGRASAAEALAKDQEKKKEEALQRAHGEEKARLLADAANAELRTAVSKYEEQVVETEPSAADLANEEHAAQIREAWLQALGANDDAHDNRDGREKFHFLRKDAALSRVFALRGCRLERDDGTSEHAGAWQWVCELDESRWEQPICAEWGDHAQHPRFRITQRGRFQREKYTNRLHLLSLEGLTGEGRLVAELMRRELAKSNSDNPV